MEWMRKLQIRLLKRDIDKNKSYVYLAKKYPMSLLVENAIFKRYKNSELYHPVWHNAIFDVRGEYLGYPYHFINEDECYLILSKENSKLFKNSIAVYDLKGNCAVPHDCYSDLYMAKDYAVLTMPMESRYEDGRTRRIEKSTDEETVMSATGKSLKETLGDAFDFPKALIISKDKIINTNYLSVKPLDIEKYYTDVLENNTIWIAQNENMEEITLKIDKRLHITETYRLPYFSHEQEIFFAENKHNAVYFLDTENKSRINLRTGERVNLLNLKREKLSKAERFAPTIESAVIENFEENENTETIELESFPNVETTSNIESEKGIE